MGSTADGLSHSSVSVPGDEPNAVELRKLRNIDHSRLAGSLRHPRPARKPAAAGHMDIMVGRIDTHHGAIRQSVALAQSVDRSLPADAAVAPAAHRLSRPARAPAGGRPLLRI